MSGGRYSPTTQKVVKKPRAKSVDCKRKKYTFEQRETVINFARTHPGCATSDIQQFVRESFREEIPQSTVASWLKSVGVCLKKKKLEAKTNQPTTGNYETTERGHPSNINSSNSNEHNLNHHYNSQFGMEIPDNIQAANLQKSRCKNKHSKETEYTILCEIYRALLTELANQSYNGEKINRVLTTEFVEDIIKRYWNELSSSLKIRSLQGYVTRFIDRYYLTCFIPALNNKEMDYYLVIEKLQAKFPNLRLQHTPSNRTIGYIRNLNVNIPPVGSISDQPVSPLEQEDPNHYHQNKINSLKPPYMAMNNNNNNNNTGIRNPLPSRYDHYSSSSSSTTSSSSTYNNSLYYYNQQQQQQPHPHQSLNSHHSIDGLQHHTQGNNNNNSNNNLGTSFIQTRENLPITPPYEQSLNSIQNSYPPQHPHHQAISTQQNHSYTSFNTKSNDQPFYNYNNAPQYQ